MKIKNKFLIVGILSCMLLFTNTTALNHLGINKGFEWHNATNIDIFSNLNPKYGDNTDFNVSAFNENDTGCSSIIVHVQSGHDVVAYRRDSAYAADTIIEKTNFAGQNAIKEYKLKKGYFLHTIITENGWIICIGGKDDPNTNKQLEKLGSDIISRGKIESGDVQKANVAVKRSGWGHFVIKSPDDDLGITAYDYRVSSSMTKLLKMKDGDYVKVPNNPRYYAYGQFKRVSSDPSNAAIKIAGTDIYGQSRKNIITYEYNNGLKNVDIWASFDGGALLGGVRGKADNILFMGNEINGKELPLIPDKKYLGGIKLQNDTIKSDGESNTKEINIMETMDFDSVFNEMIEI